MQPSHRRGRAGPGRPAGRAAVVLALLAALGLGGCGKREVDRLAQARSLVERNDRAGAIVQLKALIQQDARLGEARLMLGSLLLEDGQAGAAEIELRRALELQVPEPRVVPLLARALLLAGKGGLLVEQFGRLAWPDAAATADLRVAVAQALAAQGDAGGAQEHLAQALQAQPGHEGAQLLQVRLAAAGGDLDGARSRLAALLKDRPGSAEAWLLQGDLRLRDADGRGAAADAALAEALAAYRQALSLKPASAPAHGALIGLHLARQDGAAAQAQFEAMRKALPGRPQTVFYEAQIAALKGDLPRAAELFQLLLRGTPDHLVLLQSAASVALRMNAPAQAEAWLARALQLSPELASARRLLAQTHLAMGQPARALGVLEPLLAPGRADAAALTLAAQARLLSGDGARAAALFEQAARLRPDDPRVRTAAALGRLSRGQADAALAELQAVAAADRGDTADLALISAQLRRRDTDGALAAIAALDRKQPERAQAPHLRGQVLLARRDVAGARAAFEQALQRDGRYYPSVAALAWLDFLDGRPDAARGRFEALLRLDPDNAPARLALAELAQRSGAGRAAVAQLLEAAVKAHPGDATARLALVDHLLGGGDAKAAAAAAQAALARLPEHHELLARLGRAQLASGEAQQAVSTFRRMVALQGRSLDGHLGLAEALAAADDLPGAQRSAARALEIAPLHLPALRLAIAVALRQQQPEQALALARGLQRQRPALAAGHLLEGEVEASRQRWDAAIAALRQALGKAQPDTAPERLHAVLRAAGRTAEADALAADWARRHPRDALFQYYLGDVALNARDLAGAEQRYRAVLALQPEHALALNNVAWILLQRQQPGALALAERAAKAAPEEPAILDTLAQAQAAERRTADALATQQRALALRPDDAGLRLNLARLHLQAGDKRAAKAELDRLAALGGRFAQQGEVAALLKSLR